MITVDSVTTRPSISMTGRRPPGTCYQVSSKIRSMDISGVEDKGLLGFEDPLGGLRQGNKLIDDTISIIISKREINRQWFHGS